MTDTLAAFERPSTRPTVAAFNPPRDSIVNVYSGNMVIGSRSELQNGQLNVATGSTLSFDNGDTTNPYGG
jgi:hypothetical protein